MNAADIASLDLPKGMKRISYSNWDLYKRTGEEDIALALEAGATGVEICVEDKLAMRVRMRSTTERRPVRVGPVPLAVPIPERRKRIDLFED